MFNISIRYDISLTKLLSLAEKHDNNYDNDDRDEDDMEMTIMKMMSTR